GLESCLSRSANLNLLVGSRWEGFFMPAPQDAEKVRQRRSRVAQTLNVEERLLGGPKHCRGFSVRQDPLYGRTAHTKCGLYLLGPSLAAALLWTRRGLARQGWV